MRRRRLLVMLLIVVVLALIGVGLWALNRENNAPNAETPITNDQMTEDVVQQPQEDTVPVEEETEVIDGVSVPISVIRYIEQEYPDYIIDDADREVENSEVFYEIKLEHRDAGNDTELTLIYDENWVLLRVEQDD